MIDPEFNLIISESFRQIEDIIDSRKLLGQYNVSRHATGTNYRSAYSNTTSRSDNRYIRFDETMVQHEGDSLNNTNVKLSDSEVTVVKVKCGDMNVGRRRSKWDMHDIAIPGDGSHLGDSPSMVNLVTLVNANLTFEGEEYLVPLSSWDPYFKNEEISPYMTCCSDSKFKLEKTNARKLSGTKENKGIQLDNSSKCDKSDQVFRRQSWTERFSKFIRKRCSRPKTLPETVLLNTLNLK